MSRFEEFMSMLNRQKGGELQLEGNRASLELDDFSYDFYYDDTHQTLLLVAMVAELDANLSTLALGCICKRLMKAQLNFRECQGFSFGLSPQGDALALQGLWHLESLSEQDFVQQFESFVAVANLWEQKLRPTDLMSTGESGEDTLGMMRI